MKNYLTRKKGPTILPDSRLIVNEPMQDQQQQEAQIDALVQEEQPSEQQQNQTEPPSDAMTSYELIEPASESTIEVI